MVGFTSEGAKRVAKATRYVEHVVRGGGSLPVRRSDGDPGRYAEITGTDGSGKYSWVALEPTMDNDMTANSEWGSGDATSSEGYAVEISGNNGVSSGTHVWIYPAITQDYFLFSEPGGIKVATTSGTVSARSGNAPGSGTVTVKSYDGTSFSDDGTRAVLNSYNASVDSGTWCQIAFSDGYWWLVGADCTS